MRGSNGASEPRAASSDSAPVASADRNRVSASNRPTSAFAVENCVPLRSASPSFGCKRERLEPDGGERLGRRHDPIVEHGLADADHRGGHVGERREVARGADRALRRNDRRHAAIEHRRDAVDRLRPHAGGALGEAAELQRHHQPRDGDGRRLAHACRVRQHDVALKLREIGLIDPHAGELAEAGVDSVDRLAAGEDALDRRGARRNFLPACRNRA